MDYLRSKQKRKVKLKKALLESSALGNNKKVRKKKKKKKKKKKELTEDERARQGNLVKWLYVLMDKNRKCFASLCRGQVDPIACLQLFTSCYNEGNFGDNEALSRNTVKERGPNTTHIAWYTRNCTLLRKPQAPEFSEKGFPHWLSVITDSVVKLCKLTKDPPNCAEMVYLDDMETGWHWHSDKNYSIFREPKAVKHTGATVHLLLGHRRMFNYQPRNPKSDDHEKSIFLEDGDILVTSGSFQNDYVVQFPPNENENVEAPNFLAIPDGNKKKSTKNKASIYIVWRWVLWHDPYCAKAEFEEDEDE